MMTQMHSCDQMNQMNRSQLLHFIDIVSFQVIEAQLFLDTHPDDVEALEYFQYYIELRQKSLKIYAEKYGPLTIDSATPDNYWKWVKEPWPWEGGNC